MNLFKTSFWAALSSVIKMLAGIVTSKIMAIYIGPAGIALLGNFNNIVGILTTFSNGAISSGITKYISQYESEEEKRSIVSHALKITLVCSVLLGLVVIFLKDVLSKMAFGNTEYSNVFVILGVTVIFFGLNATVTGVLNGYTFIRELILTGILGSILSMFLAYFITIRFGLFGALVNAIIAQIFIFGINVFFVNKLKLFNRPMLYEQLDKPLLVNLLKYALMSIVSALVVPVSTLVIRKYVFDNFSGNEAGYVQGIWSISNTYLSVVTTTLSIYYLPTLSGIKDRAKLRAEIKNGYKFILPLAVLAGVMIFIFRDLIIKILYTPEFLPMREYFTFQIIGDGLKIASWILAYLMVAKAMTKLFIVTEVIFSLTYVIFSVVFMNVFGSVGVTYGYALNYFLYLILMLFLFRKILLPNRKDSEFQ